MSLGVIYEGGLDVWCGGFELVNNMCHGFMMYTCYLAEIECKERLENPCMCQLLHVGGRYISLVCVGWLSSVNCCGSM